jgi:quinol monooxygenase YgiN
MTDAAVTIVIRYRALPAHADRARDELDALLAEVVRQEPDCLGIQLLHDDEAPHRLLLIERWTSREAYFGPHLETPHIRAFIERAPAFLAGPPEITAWTPVSEHLPAPA